MKQLLALTALLLTLGTAHAQAVTKLPGEENLSLRERAERDFLMPVRRKKVVADAPTKEAKEVKTIAEEMTAAPESDGTTTAHYSEATDETTARADEAAAPAREARATRSFAERRAIWLARRRAAYRAEERAAERRAEARAEARRAAAHKGSKSKLAKSKIKASAAHKSSKGSKVKIKVKASAKSTKNKGKASSKKSGVKSKAHKVVIKKASGKKHRR